MPWIAKALMQLVMYGVPLLVLLHLLRQYRKPKG